MVKKSLCLSTYINEFDDYGNVERRYLCEESNLIIAALRHIPFFSTKCQLYSEIGKMLLSDDDCKIDFIKDISDIFYYDPIDILNQTHIEFFIKSSINESKNNQWIVNIVRKLVKWDKNEIWIQKFEKKYNKIFNIVNDDDLPF